MNGYDQSLFVHEPEIALMCNICHLVLKKPTSVCINGHTYCQECIKHLEASVVSSRGNSEPATCPECRLAITEKHLNRPLETIIMTMVVRCPEAAEDGEQCEWTGTLADYLEAHEGGQQCTFLPVPCPLGCDLSIRAHELESHVSSECLNRLVTCEYCKAEVTFGTLASHHDGDCPDKMVACDYCGEEILRKDLGSKPSTTMQDDHPDDTYSYSHHYSVCPKLLLKCKFAKHGCCETFNREDAEKHYDARGREHADLVYDGSGDNALLEEHVFLLCCDVTWDIPKSAIMMEALASLERNDPFEMNSKMCYKGNISFFLKLEMKKGKIYLSVCIPCDVLDSQPLIRQLTFAIECDSQEQCGPQSIGGFAHPARAMQQDEVRPYFSSSLTLKTFPNHYASSADLLRMVRDGHCRICASFELSGANKKDYFKSIINGGQVEPPLVNRLPHAVYSLIWSFLLKPNDDPVASSPDLKTMRSFMFVNKASLAAFREMNGWSKCAENFKREANAKKAHLNEYERLHRVAFQEAAAQVRAGRVIPVHTFMQSDPIQSLESQRASMRDMEIDVLIIHQIFFPEACILSAIHDGYQNVPSRKGFYYSGDLFRTLSHSFDPLKEAYLNRTVARRT